jgi:hypothetical protein
VSTDSGRAFGSIESGVLFGKGDQLFLADGGHAVLDFVLGKRVASHTSIQTFSENIRSRHSLAVQLGIPYLHVIFPDKQSVLIRQFPFENPVCLGEVYLAAAPEVADQILYPRNQLRKLGETAFQRTDTHLTDLGTATIARYVLDRLTGRSHAAEFAAIIDRIDVPQEWAGDLGRRFTPHLSEIRLTFRSNRSIKWLHNNLSGANNGLVDLTFNTDALYDKRLLIFGDSFGRELTRFLALFISQVVFLRTPFLHQEMLEQISPDMLVTDNVERYLSSCSSDECRPSFLLYPFLGSGQYAPTREFADALSAVLGYPRKPYSDLRRSLGFAG